MYFKFRNCRLDFSIFPVKSGSIGKPDYKNMDVVAVRMSLLSCAEAEKTLGSGWTPTTLHTVQCLKCKREVNE